MELLNKSTVYSRLMEIKKNYNIDVSSYIKDIVRNGDTTSSVVAFINKYYPLPILETYNRIYSKRHKNPLYKSLVNENSTSADQAIALASLLTQIMITDKELSESDREIYHKVMNTNIIIEAIDKYITEGCNITETFLEVREIFKKLYER